jgi:hypothetical protein
MLEPMKCWRYSMRFATDQAAKLFVLEINACRDFQN